MKALINIISIILFILPTLILKAQLPTAPTILEVNEDDRATVIYWNSKTQTYHSTYDPDKQQGIYSYVVEWGPVSAGFIHKEVTPYRAFQAQPLTPNVVYKARVFALDSDGNKSLASNVMQFQHSDVKVNDMRNRLNGFFDDFNAPMGGFDETKWNQAYNGCNEPGYQSQHINNQFHAHNILRSGYCDRGVASSRVREVFDFTNRTGVIEFDMDGSKERQRWYLDISPASTKNDITGQIHLPNANPPKADPGFMLRILEIGKVQVQLADQNGRLYMLPNMYRNGACGENLRHCPGNNLTPIPNVRKHWRIELSKTDLRIFVEGILVIDVSLQTSYTPNGLTFEQAQVNWIFFSYSTQKANLTSGMIHWDNFGFDAPVGWTDNTIVHNYTDGTLVANSPTSLGNRKNAGAYVQLIDPGIFQIPIPDPVQDLQGNWPLQTELMFTLQGSQYTWTTNDYITVNGHQYNFPEPVSNIANLTENELIGTNNGYTAILNIDPAHLNTGNNELKFYLNRGYILNVHIELEFPKSQAPSFTQPMNIFPNYMQTLMEFRNNYEMGPGFYINEINGVRTAISSEFAAVRDNNNKLIKYVKQTPVSGVVDFDISANSDGQLTGMAHAFGIEYFDVYIDSQIVETVFVNADEPVAAFSKTYQINTDCLANGPHDIFFRAFDVNGRPSVYDKALSSQVSGTYLPIEITVNNSNTQPTLNAKVLLEGAYAGANQMTTELISKQLLVKQQPFTVAPWFYTGSEQVTSFPPNVVDWVLVSLRTSVDRSTEVVRFAALLTVDGQIVDVGGCPPALSVNTASPLFVAIYHQNHLNVVSPTAIPFDNGQFSHDFTSENSFVAGFGQKEISPGVWAMYSGNGDQETLAESKDINGQDQAKWISNNGLFNLYTPWDYNLDGDVNGLDKILWSYNNGVFTGVD